ncbi:MAG: Gfo/Idh/MocA family protein [Acutalibacteraceae bacterium]
MVKLKTAVIGCGSVSVMHLDSASALPQSDLRAVCDIIPEKAAAAAKKYGAAAYTDYKKMLEAEQPDVVHICLPHYLHAPVSQYALSHGANVLCEKPMSIKYSDAEKTVEAAEKADRLYGVIFQCRYNHPAALVKKRIVSGKLGRVLCARVTLTWSRSDEYYSGSDWKGTWDKEGGGVVIDQAIHALDLANWMIDSVPVSVQSSLHNRGHDKMKVEDSAEGFIRYENGATLGFWAMNNYLIDEPIEIRLHCERGNAVLSYNDAEITYFDQGSETCHNPKQDLVAYSGGREYWGTRHAVQINQFYNSVLRGESPEISGREALKLQKLICEIYDRNDNKLL